MLETKLAEGRGVFEIARRHRGRRRAYKVV